MVRFRPLERGADGVRSGAPRTLALPQGSFVRAQVTIRDDGAWMLPLFLCRTAPGARWTGSHDVAAVADEHRPRRDLGRSSRCRSRPAACT